MNKNVNKQIDPFVGILIVMTCVVGIVLFLTLSGGEEIDGEQWVGVGVLLICWTMRIGIPFAIKFFGAKR